MINRKIAIFSGFDQFPGGVERMNLHLLAGFSKRGYDIDLLLFTAEGPLLSQIPDNINVIDFGNPRLLGSVTKLLVYFKHNKPSIMYCTSTDRGFAAMLAKILSMSGTHIIIGMRTQESMLPYDPSSIKQNLLRRLKKILCPLASLFIPVSYGVAEDTIDNLGVSRGKIKVIYNPVVTEKLKENMQKPVSHPWISEKTQTVILAVGRLEPQKDFVTLIQAFQQVIQQIDSKLIILGEGSQRQMLTELIDELSLSEQVDMPGFVDNPYAYMKNADLFVLSSKYEGLGNVLIEAMACGCPIVSTNCPSGPSEILDDGEYGTLVPVEDIQSLSNAMVKVLKQEHDIGKLLQRAEYFSEDRIIDEYIEALQLN